MAIGLPIKLGVIFVVALIVIGILLVLLYYIPGVTGEQSEQASLSACCTKFVLGGYCDEDSYNPYVNCTPVGADISPDGWIYIEDLATKGGYAGQEGVISVCCK